MSALKQFVVIVAGIVVSFGISASAIAGPDWIEEGDAGNSLQGAQSITGASGTQVQRISGNLSGPAATSGGAFDDFEDVYQIYISDPTILLFSTVGNSTNFQTSLYLFSSDGFGLLGNVITPDGMFTSDTLGSEIQNFATDETGIVITTPGIYYLAVAGHQRHPLSGESSIFSFSHPHEVSGPDGPGGGGPFNAWGGNTNFGSYEIDVQGVSFIPAPSALALLAVGTLGASRRRRD